MGNSPFLQSRTVIAIGLIGLLFLLRFALLSIFPLYDTTEARYAEMARLMVETGNWVTPQIDYQVPFWGKPPMHTWLSAMSLDVFGITAFAARLPHFLCGVLVALLVYRFTKQHKDETTAIFSVLVLSSSIGFFIAIGMVMTDTALMLSTTLAMLSFWNVYSKQDDIFHGHLFFVALAFGMLIKGPVAIVIVGLGIGVWSLWQRNLKRVLCALPWKTGTTMFLLITVPWYWLAELSSPGFLEYFVMGEHVYRFLVPGWEGDLYGNAHQQPRGMIWAFWLIAAFPWSFVLVANGITAIRAQGRIIETSNANTPILTYLMSWMIAPLLLFSFAGNVLTAYVLPGFTAMAILIATQNPIKPWHVVLVAMSLCGYASLPVLKAIGFVTKTSEVELIGEEPALYAESPLIYWQKRPFSAAFYSHGAARLIEDIDELHVLINDNDSVFVALEHHVSVQALGEFQGLCYTTAQTADRTLVHCRSLDEVTVGRR